MPAPQPASVPMRMRKWGGLPHWEYKSVPLGSDSNGDWFGTPIGTHFTRPGRDYRSEHEHVVLVPRPGLLGGHNPAADWVATFYAADCPTHTYVDITTPTRVTSAGVLTTDLDLDVVRRADGTVYIDDEDEFAEHQLTLGYPAAVVAAAREVCDLVHAAVLARTEPFGVASRTWLTRLADLPG